MNRPASRCTPPLVAVLFALALAPGRSRAQNPGGPVPRALEGVGLEERLGAKVPGGLAFTDPAGRTVRLSDHLHRNRPVILTLVYYDCPMLCGLLLTGLVRGLEGTGLALGRDYDVVTVSFNPRDTPAVAGQKQGHYLQALGRPEAKASWPFLVGADADIRALAGSVGFKYRWDGRSSQYAHVAAVYVLTPEGTISRYLYGVDFPARDLKLALLEAGGGRIGTTLQRVLLTCYRYDPATRRYAFFMHWYFKVGGLLLLAALVTLIGGLVRWERRAAATTR